MDQFLAKLKAFLEHEAQVSVMQRDLHRARKILDVLAVFPIQGPVGAAIKAVDEVADTLDNAAQQLATAAASPASSTPGPVIGPGSQPAGQPSVDPGKQTQPGPLEPGGDPSTFDPTKSTGS